MLLLHLCLKACACCALFFPDADFRVPCILGYDLMCYGSGSYLGSGSGLRVSWNLYENSPGSDVRIHVPTYH